MQPLYPDIESGNIVVRSVRVANGFHLMLIKNGVVVQQETFTDWSTYSQRYDMVVTMLRFRARMV